MKLLVLALLSVTLLMGEAEFKSDYKQLKSEFSAEKKVTKKVTKKAEVKKSRYVAAQKSVSPVHHIAMNSNIILRVTTYSQVSQYAKKHKYLKYEKYKNEANKSLIITKAASMNAVKVLYYKAAKGSYYYYFGS